jgi:LysM repeat protein
MGNMANSAPWATQAQASAHVRATRKAPTLQLTRRGRVLLFIVAIAVLLGLMLVGGKAVGNVVGGSSPTQSMTVESGQTLWGIAQSIAKPHEDVRDVVAELQSLNNIPNGNVEAGQQLFLPGH